MALTQFDSGIDYARAADARDELAKFRNSFAIPQHREQQLTYLCGHSLGLMPLDARRRLTSELDRWSERGVEGHFGRPGWFSYHEQFAAPLARLSGALPTEVVAMNSLTTNLHLMLVSFFEPTGNRRKIAIERGAFPSDRYAVESQLRYHGLDPARDLVELSVDDGTQLLTPEILDQPGRVNVDEIALILLPGVQFLTGQALDIAGFAQKAAQHGCRIGFDLAHAIGNLPLQLHASGADFAVWCSYKYLNGGPGAIGGCFVHERWLGRRDIPRFEGWWGHEQSERFALGSPFKPMPTAEAWQLSNPPVLAMAPLAAALALFDDAGADRLRTKSVALTGYLERLLTAECGERIRLLTPSAPAARGAQLSLQIEPKNEDVSSLAERLRAAGIIADWREPNVLRLAPVPLYNSYEDVYAAVQALKQALHS